VPMSDLPHDRHVRFVGDGKGLWAEAVRGLTGLRRDPARPPGRRRSRAKVTPAIGKFANTPRDPLDYIPEWGDYTLFQPAASAFTIRKRTKTGCGWIDADQGHRAAGVGYVGGAKGGGVAFGLRDFWQRHPTQLDIRGANTAVAEVTLWLCRLRRRRWTCVFTTTRWAWTTIRRRSRDGSHLRGLRERVGHAARRRPFERDLSLGAGRHAVPRADRRAADAVRRPPQLICAPGQYLGAKVFGALWSLPTGRPRPGLRSRIASTGSSPITSRKSSGATGTDSGTLGT